MHYEHLGQGVDAAEPVAPSGPVDVNAGKMGTTAKVAIGVAAGLAGLLARSALRRCK
jgi:hypothetical protein